MRCKPTTITNIMKQSGGENFFESMSKAAIRYGTSTITTAYLGAVGSKTGPIGTLGSLTIASYINDKIEKAID